MSVKESVNVQDSSGALFLGELLMTGGSEKSIGSLRLSRQGRNAFAIARELRIWPAENAEGLIRTARSLGEARLRHATDRLAEIDYRTKTGLGEARRAVEDFILRSGG